jgi:hypothetical protein
MDVEYPCTGYGLPCDRWINVPHKLTFFNIQKNHIASLIYVHIWDSTQFYNHWWGSIAPTVLSMYSGTKLNIYKRWVASDLMAHCKPSTSIGPECLYVFGSTLIWWLVIYYLHLPLIPNVLYSHFMELYACRCDWLQQARICYSTSTTYFQIFVEPKRNRLNMAPFENQAYNCQPLFFPRYLQDS